MNDVTTPVAARSPTAGGARTRTSWPVPVALLALSFIPLTAGALRLIQLAGGPAVIPPDDRFTGFPVALVVHIIGAGVFALVGILQFMPEFRRKHLTWHRRTGRVLAVAGLMVAGSALWLTLAYSPKSGTGDVLYAFRLVFASAMVGALVLGVLAARARQIPTHRAWMIRAYAVGLAAGTQAFTEPLGGALFGSGDVRDDLAKGAGWVLNLAIAECAIRRQPRRPSGRQPREPAPATQPPTRSQRSIGTTTTNGATTATESRLRTAARHDAVSHALRADE